MNIETQIIIRNALDAGGKMKALAKEHGVPFGTVRKAANAGWPEIPSLLPEDGGAREVALPGAPPPPSPSTSATPTTTMDKLLAVQAEYNPKLLLRETARIIHLHLLRVTTKGELKIMDLVGAGRLIKDLLYIQQNTGAAKEEDKLMIERLQLIAESGDPQGIIDYYIEMANLYEGVTNPDVVAEAELDTGAEA